MQKIFTYFSADYIRRGLAWRPPHLYQLRVRTAPMTKTIDDLQRRSAWL
jgi:hypothetical protein